MLIIMLYGYIFISLDWKGDKIFISKEEGLIPIHCVNCVTKLLIFLYMIYILIGFLLRFILWGLADEL